MLAPDGPGDAIQFIDVRDLARFTLDVVENNIGGTFNVVSPPGRFTIGDLLTASISCANALAKPPVAPRPVWVPPEFMQRHNVALATDMPIWSAPTEIGSSCRSTVRSSSAMPPHGSRRSAPKK